ncbi:MAG: UvrD-helicase domain-containing protein [Erysipelotrichaceae bacterium]|nr:UvrD-helicase domain-containing protein [Erysipelotrichaceae bacterium]
MKISEKNNLSQEQSVACNSSGMGIVVSASAGAGKTKVLVSRLMKRCVEDHPRVPLSRILALTFTEAAASEMKKRVAVELSEIKELALQEENVDTELVQYIDEQIIALASANITTIDSYCLSIIKKYYNIIGLDPATTQNILSSGQNENIQLEAFMHALKQAYEDHPQDIIALTSFFSSRSDDYDGLYQAVSKINRYAESSIDPIDWFEKAIKAYPPTFDPNRSDNFTSFDAFPMQIRKYYFASLYGQLSLIQRDIEIIQNLPEAINGKGKLIDNSAAFDKFLSMINDMHAELMPSHNDDTYTYAVYDKYKQVIQILADTKLSGYKKDEYPEHFRAIDHLKKTLKNIVEERLNEDDFVKDARDTSNINQSLLSLARNTYENTRLMKQEKTAMYFSDMERYAYEILKHENIAKVIRDNLLEVMIDEFQDTSTLQDTIIERIANPNCIFRVGDTKQSIYRFRQAKPELMRSKLNVSTKITQETVNQAIPAKIILSRNYRSDAKIIQFTNTLFTKIMNVNESKENYGDEDTVDWFPQNDHSDALIEFAQYTGNSSAYVSSDDKEESDDLKRIKANYIANKIADIYNQEKQDAIQNGTQPPSFHDFAILVRGHSDKAYLKAAFDQKGIPYSIDTRDGFYHSEVCQTIIALCTAILDNDQELPLFACMVSNLYNYTDNQIAQAKIQYGSIKEVAKELGVLEDLQMYKELADTYGIASMLSKIAEHNDYFNRLNINQQSNFDYLFEMTVSAKYKSIAEFLNALKAVEDEVSNEAVSKGSADDIVTVTTIHHSKGLQYKYVFLWSNTTNMFMDNRDVYNIDDELYLGLDCITTTPFRTKRKTIQKRAIEFKANMEDAEEFIRILYVAVTRAVRRLYIVDAIPKPVPYRGNQFMLGDLLIRNGMSGLILSTMANEPIMKQSVIDPSWDVKLNYQEQKEDQQLPHYGYSSIEEKEVLTPSSTEYGNSLPALNLNETRAGMEYGTYIHACFEQLPDRLFTVDDLSFMNLKPSQIKHLLAFGESTLFKEAIQGEIHHEYPFYVQTQKEKIHGIMDFIAIQEDKIILIDFKTDNVELEQIQKLYTQQINTYRKALQYIYPDKKIDAYAWSVHHDKEIKI